MNTNEFLRAFFPDENEPILTKMNRFIFGRLSQRTRPIRKATDRRIILQLERCWRVRVAKLN
jgi:hypothetical protein